MGAANPLAVNYQRSDLTGPNSLDVLRRFRPQDPECRATRGAMNHAHSRRRLVIESGGHQRLHQHAVEDSSTAGAPWSHALARSWWVDALRRERGARIDDRVAKMTYVDVESAQHLTREAFDVEHPEQDVPSSHLGLSFLAGEPARPTECTLGARRERQRLAGV